MAFALTLGGVTFLLAVIWGGPLIEIMRRFNLGKKIRIEGPQTHLQKMGTPAMGGHSHCRMGYPDYGRREYGPDRSRPGNRRKHRYSPRSDGFLRHLRRY